MPAPVSVIDTSNSASPGSDLDPQLVLFGGAWRNRLHGVDEQVEKHLAQAGLVAFHRGDFGELLHEMGAAADFGVREVQAAVEDLPDVQRSLGVLGDGEGSQVAHDSADTIQSIAGVADRQLNLGPVDRLSVARGSPGDLLPHEREVADDV